MRYDEFIKTVSERDGHDDREIAVQTTEVVLADLGQRLKGGEADNLAAQLPEELKGPLTEHAATEPVVDDVDDFLRRVATHLGAGVDPEQARHHVAAVFATLSEAVSEGEIQNLRSQLPAGFGPLFK
ncbi:DUF2267 domain-containing protein [Nesterenkonia sphaerica]|uniref:DUF2267 domain-containing protein n=1 Tax=Nesterenkonia sphaerica TaxID=1804988 RepID=A0A5R9AD63_9MICC|nr:DUF2267 domain-containing protein [Nesterenkonia sphaerica]TLP75807.1 DUF2267 domain-containing protein [Nesterenkonia sphaerica]